MYYHVAIFLIFVSTQVFGVEFKEHCDLIGKELRSLSRTQKDTCKDQCLKDPACQGAVFISAWNKCFLKSEVKREHKVIMSSGLKNGTLKKAHDFSGKDYKKLDLGDSDKCQKACQQEGQCIGFTYIGGYRTCWLKRTTGRIFPKTFYCFAKP